ncbi:hypothetical protein OH77DRAFT_1524264 [Trametes cingulata]|nr:hypothetical protein OH77DRAFT_1524264 [Trametes cingulata]
MSGNSTGSASTVLSIPSGVSTAIDVSSSLSILLVGTVVSSFLIPISTALMYFTMPKSRRRPQLLMIFASLVLGLGEGGLNIYNQVCAIMKRPVLPAITTTYAFVHLFLPLLTESVLAFRVCAEHPPKSLSWPRWLLLYGVMIVLKLARLVVLVAIAVSWISKTQALPGPIQGGLDALTAINRLPTQVKWALQVADTLFMSVLFFPWPKRGQKVQQPDHLDIQVEVRSFFQRAKTLFWNAVSSFVFPVLLNLVQFALVLVQDGVFQFPSLFAANNQAGIIGMVFATVWTPGGGGSASHATRTAGATLQQTMANADSKAASVASGLELMPELTTAASGIPGVLSHLRSTRGVSDLTTTTMNTLTKEEADHAPLSSLGGIGRAAGVLRGAAMLAGSLGGSAHHGSMANAGGLFDCVSSGGLRDAWDDVEKGDIGGILGALPGGLGHRGNRLHQVQEALHDEKSTVVQVASREVEEETRVVEESVTGALEHGERQAIAAGSTVLERGKGLAAQSERSEAPS